MGEAMRMKPTYSTPRARAIIVAAVVLIAVYALATA
jgi:hypothetical protein